MGICNRPVVDALQSLPPIRIGLAVIPRLARDVLRDILSRHGDIEVLDLAVRSGSTLADGDATNCDVIVRSAPPDGAMTTLELHGLFGRADSGTLVVLVDDALIRIAEVRAASCVVDPAPDALVDAIRAQLAAMHDRER
jgi:hypothetical protein